MLTRVVLQSSWAFAADNQWHAGSQGYDDTYDQVYNQPNDGSLTHELIAGKGLPDCNLVSSPADCIYLLKQVRLEDRVW